MLYILHKAFGYFMKIECEFFCSQSSMRSRGRSGFSKKTRVKTVVGEEWRYIRGFLKSVVVYKFCKWKQFKPVILFIIAKDTEIGFKGLIHSFYLMVGLEMECSRFSGIDFQNRSEYRPEIEHENGAAI